MKLPFENWFSVYNDAAKSCCTVFPMKIFLSAWLNFCDFKLHATVNHAANSLFFFIQSRSVFVKNLNFKTSDDDLKKHFSDHLKKGSIRSVKVDTEKTSNFFSMQYCCVYTYFCFNHRFRWKNMLKRGRMSPWVLGLSSSIQLRQQLTYAEIYRYHISSLADTFGISSSE